MLWLTLSRIFSTILALIQVGRMTNSEKDLEIIILRHQLDVMVQLQSKPIKSKLYQSEGAYFTMAARQKLAGILATRFYAAAR